MPADAQRLEKAVANEEAVQRLIQYFGVSSLTELTDELTRMAPVEQLRVASTLVKKAGGIARANDAIDRTVKNGMGKPACLLVDGSTSRAKPLATVIGYETRLEFQTETPELSAVLTRMGIEYASVRSLRLAEFKQVFSRLGALYPDCMYAFNLIEKTRYVEPRDAATANGNVRVVPRRG
ncbi:hypothetical protein QCE63_11595 [Caballeronia sp. LZ065]|uniref:hypothetical protein n=1 Tax=Caballeronia sp. LZ065 TaxID=3038571 RepID=UPI002857E4C9|nr:hypothetical protein [Caballeronia sp. LZ065]MDR5780062.1 hypothetical protein [Caballeronia sp. LZ065]